MAINDLPLLDIGVAEPAILQAEAAGWFDQRVRDEMSFTAVWAVQSRLAGFCLIAIVALLSAWLALAAMLTWSLAATVLYFVARQRGAPDLVDFGLKSCHKKGHFSILGALTSGARLLIVGPFGFLFTRLFSLSLRRSAAGPARMLRLAGLSLGLMLFGVTTSHHLLQESGYSGRRLLQLSCVASVLNVSYRVAISAVMMEALAYVLSLPHFA